MAGIAVISFARRPLRRMAAERHRRTGPKRRGFRQNRGVPDRPQCTEARTDLLDEGRHRFPRKITDIEAVGDPPEIPQPASGLRQRHLNVPASAFARAGAPSMKYLAALPLA